jgi:hypothetical protein
VSDGRILLLIVVAVGLAVLSSKVAREAAKGLGVSESLASGLVGLAAQFLA